MRLKYYLRGIGLGIIFTVIVLSVSNNSNKSTDNSVNTENISSGKTDITHENSEDSKIIEDSEADSSIDGTENQSIKENINNTEISDKKEYENNQSGSQADDTSNQPDSQAVDTSNQPDSQVADTPNQPPASETVAEPQIITITVQQGEYCRPIAQKLKDAGLIEDAEDFRLYMGQIGYASFIHSGDFQIPMGASYEEIANILIRK